MNKKIKILIVDDNDKLCNNLSDILTLKGYDTYGVYDGYEAIDFFKKHNFDIVLMDVKMPGINGIDTLNMLKKIKPAIRAIVITAFADNLFYQGELKDNDFEIIQKPVDVDKLCLMLEKMAI